ncbi:hypothetical protein [Amycolatopsis ultiminotia]
MSTLYGDATQAEVDYRVAELRRAAGHARRGRPNRALRWLRAHLASGVPVPRQERRTPVPWVARARDHT